MYVYVYPIKNRYLIYDGSFVETKLADGSIPVVNVGITKEQIDCLNKIWDMYSQEKALQAEVKNNFNNLLYSLKTIKKLCLWYNSIKYNVNITSVGRVIAHTNAKRMDNTLPDLD